MIFGRLSAAKPISDGHGMPGMPRENVSRHITMVVVPMLHAKNSVMNCLFDMRFGTIIPMTGNHTTRCYRLRSIVSAKKVRSALRDRISIFALISNGSIGERYVSRNQKLSMMQSSSSTYTPLNLDSNSFRTRPSIAHPNQTPAQAESKPNPMQSSVEAVRCGWQ